MLAFSLQPQHVLTQLCYHLMAQLLHRPLRPRTCFLQASRGISGDVSVLSLAASGLSLLYLWLSLAVSVLSLSCLWLCTVSDCIWAVSVLCLRCL